LLFAAARQNPELLTQAQALVTDRFFVGTEMQGLQLAEEIHAAWPKLPIHLCSQIQDRSSLHPAFQGFVAKDPESIQAFLKTLVATAVVPRIGS
jgi:hypothetical protein